MKYSKTYPVEFPFSKIARLQSTCYYQTENFPGKFAES